MSTAIFILNSLDLICSKPSCDKITRFDWRCFCLGKDDSRYFHRPLTDIIQLIFTVLGDVERLLLGGQALGILNEQFQRHMFTLSVLDLVPFGMMGRRVT